MSKLKLYTENEEGTAAWLDFHLNLVMIDGKKLAFGLNLRNRL